MEAKLTIIESIKQEPDRWRTSEYCLIHDSGAELWIKNGVFFCQPYPGGKFGIISKFKAWSAYKWWCKNAPTEAFGVRK